MANELEVPEKHDPFTIADPEKFKDLKSLAKSLIGSGFLPDSIKEPSQAIVVMLQGRELGIPAMQSFQMIDPIKGKPTTKPKAMIALAERSGELEDWSIERSEDPLEVTCRVKRRGRSEKTETWNLERAARYKTRQNGKTVKLIEKYNWKQDPLKMLEWRAIGGAFRQAFPDVIGGLYTPDEARSMVDDESISEADYEVVEDEPVNGVDQQSEKMAEDLGSSDEEEENNGAGESEAASEALEQDEESSSPSEDALIETMADEFKKDTLKSICRDRGLNVSGNKFELAERLVDDGLEPDQVNGWFDDEEEQPVTHEEGTDSSEDELSMFEIMKQTKDLLEELEEAKFSDVKMTVDEIGSTPDAVQRIADHLQDCVTGEADYETDESGVIQLN